MEGQRMQVLSRVCVLSIGVSLFVCNAIAQQSGAISGVVSDVTGKGIPNAVVTVRNEAGGAPRIAAADSEGKYAIKDLADGSYQVEASAPSFSISRKTGVKVAMGNAVNVA